MKETRHLGVYGLIINSGKILLVKKARGAYIGKYDLPGGSIEHSEKPIETLKREIMEETGSTVKNAVLIDANSVVVNWLHHEVEESMHHIGIIYDVTIEDGKIKEDADGLDSLGANWCVIDNLTKDMLSPLTVEALKKKNIELK